VVRLLSEEFRRREWPSRNYARFVRYGGPGAQGTSAAAGRAADRDPVWALKRATEIGAEMAENIAALRVRVIGALSSLGDLPETDAEPGPPALPGRRCPSGNRRRHEGGRRGRAEDSGPLRDLDARSMTRALARRSRQRMRRTLRLQKVLGAQKAQPGG
jgi:hypothetical protein